MMRRKYVVYSALTGIIVSRHRTLVGASWSLGRRESKGITVMGEKFSMRGMFGIARVE